MINFQQRDEARHRVHRRLLRAATGFLTGGPTGAVGGFLSPSARKQPAIASKFRATPVSSVSLSLTPARRRAITRAMTAATARGAVGEAAAFLRELGSQGPLGAGVSIPQIPQIPIVGCIPPFRLDPITGKCKLFIGDVPGPDPKPPGTDVVLHGGDPFHHPPGHHHPVVPEVFTDGSTRDGVRRRCPRKYVLGEDNMCYFGLARNSKWRKWSPGRRPLFTGGQLNAIKITAGLRDKAETIFKDTNPEMKAVSRSYRSNWRKPLKSK